MEPLDGNAIAGLMADVFGAEMTTAASVCQHCGAGRPVAQLVVYKRAPGTVVRCRSCCNVVMVFAEVRGVVCADLSWVELEHPSARASATS
jgi:hypothetical protein